MNSDTQVSSETAALSEYIRDALVRDYPERTLERARLHILDTLAAAISGSYLPAGRAGRRLVSGALRADGRSSVVGLEGTTDPVDAALANGMCAHADETDDSHEGSISHPGCGIVPAALAVAEATDATGADLTRAVIVGYDVGTRVVRALGLPPDITGRGAYSTHAYAGIFGAAAAASVLYRQPLQAVRHTLSYAAQLASGTTIWLRDTDHIQKAMAFAGMPASQGVRAAVLVENGWTGVDDPFTGRPNFLTAISLDSDVTELVRSLGEEHAIEQTNLKKYAVGSPAQAAVEAALEIAAAHAPRWEDIENVTIVLPAEGAAVVDDRDMPSISVQYLVACALHDRAFSFAMAHDEERLRAADTREMMSRITLTPEPSWGRERRARVCVRLRDGRSYERAVDVMPGSHRKPLTTEEVRAKALDLMQDTIGGDGASAVIEEVLRLEDRPSLHELSRRLRFESA